MKKLTKLNLIGVILFLSSCSPSMSPIEVSNTLPTLTKSKFISQAQLETNNCKILSKNRSYTAPIAFTKKLDLKNGARGIDEWVTLDGGNAYVLRNYQWVNIGDEGATQLHVEFDTLLCE